MKELLRSFIVFLIITGAPLLAATGSKTPQWKGTIQCQGKHSHEELAKMAKVSEEDARMVRQG